MKKQILPARKHWIYLILFFLVTIWSGYRPFDLTLWFLEAGFCLIGVALLIMTFKRFRFTDQTYFFIFIHLMILLIGAHYSYSRVPFFDELGSLFNLDRNNYDKVGHFAQGFVPAMIARELLIRLNVIKKLSWLPFLVICICLSISAFYELIEWWVALLSEESAEDFLGTQGYEWDTQSDMLCALLGAVSMLIFLSGRQNKQIREII